MLELLKLLKAAKESELEVIAQIYERELKKNGEEEEAEVPKKKTPVKKASSKKTEKQEDEEQADGEDYESMTAKKLYELCCQRGLSGKVAKNRVKDNLVKILRENDAEQQEENDDSWDDEDDGIDYTTMTPKELYGECKKRGIAAKTGKKAEVYIKLLEKYDEENSDDESDDDGEDWEID